MTLFRRQDYRPATSLDRIVTSALLLVEMPLVLGFCYPLLIPLAWFGLLLNAGVFLVVVKYLDVTFENPPTVTFHYLGLSLAVGSAIAIWLWQESDLHGKWLITFGIPLAAILVVWESVKIGIKPSKARLSYVLTG